MLVFTYTEPRAQNSTNRFHSLSYWIPIMNCENYISLLLNFQIFCLKIFLFKETIFDISVFPITFRIGNPFSPLFYNFFPEFY